MGGGGGGLLLAAALLFAANSADAQQDLWDIQPRSVSEGIGTAALILTRPSLNQFPVSERLEVEVVSNDGTAVSNDTVPNRSDQDFRSVDFIDIAFEAGSVTSNPINITIFDDFIYEGDEYFTMGTEVPMELPDGTVRSLPVSWRITIKDNDLPPTTDIGGGMNAVARAEALVDNQPNLIRMLRNSGSEASEFSLRANSEGVDASGGFQGEAVWGATSISRTSDEFGEHEYLLATLGAQFWISERLHLGGMLQFDQSRTEPGGEGVTGKIKGDGWMGGPYFAFRDVSNPLYFEGRLLYGRTSDDIEDYVPAQGQDARSASLDGDRWLIQGRVEGMLQLGNGMTLIPLADFSHARDEMEAFEDSRGIAGGTRAVAVTKLQLGAEFEIPVDTARGDLKLRPGLRLVVSDSSNIGVVGKATVGTGESAEYRGRIDFGVGYRLDDDLVLGFESFYSGRDQEEFDSYGAGLNLQFEF